MTNQISKFSKAWKLSGSAQYVYRQHRHSNLHHLLYEIVDNSMDEALAGFCDRIHVVILRICLSCKITGGIPVGINPKYGIPAVEIVFTMLHAGGKFGGGGF